MSQNHPHLSDDSSFFGCEDGDLSVCLMQKLITRNFEKRDCDEKGMHMLKLASEISMKIFSGNRLWSVLKEDGSMIEKLIPTLIISIERLLEEVELKGLTNEETVCPNFNPIDFLAQHLHHNNPRYLNVPVLSTYILRLRNITKELCNQLYNNDKKRNQSLKEKAQRKREQQSYKNQLRQDEMDERLLEIKKQFSEWMMPFQNKLELKSVKGALQSFVEFSNEVPKEIFESSESDLNPSQIEDSDKLINSNEFSEIILEFTTNMDRYTYGLLMKHLRKYAAAYQYSFNTQVRRRVLTNLFMALDKSEFGVLDRHRVLRLLEELWESTTEDMRSVLNHPKRWPVVEVEESEYPFDEPESASEPESKPKEDEIKSKEGNEMNKEPTKKEGSPEMKSSESISSSPKNSENSSALKKSDKDSQRESPKKSSPTAPDADTKLPDTPPKTSTGAPRPVSFVERCLRDREQTNASLTSVSASAFDEDTLNMWQFVQLMENFMGTQHVKIVFETVTDFIFNNYVETEEERQERQEKARLEMETSKCKQLADALFDKWDNDSTGYLELNQVEAVSLKYKGGKEAMKKAKAKLKTRPSDDRLSKKEFRNFVQDVTKCLPGQNEYESFIDFLRDKVELSQLELTRGDTRKKWLNSIITTGKTNGTQLSPVFNRVFSTICKDSNIHGGGKKINAYIALLVPNHKDPEQRGENFLHYMAATPDHADFVKGQILYRDMKGVSFMCVDKGVPVYVPKVKNHGNIHFWNQGQWKSDEKTGSFLLVPLKDNRKRVFGVLGIDTINDLHEKIIFLTHEINFYQGVAKAFSIAYHQVEVRKRVIKILKSANRWIHRHCIDVCEICVYIVEENRNTQEIILKKLMVTTPQGSTETFEQPIILERKDSLFRDYLFRCVDNSETVSDEAYGQYRLAFPLRDKDAMVSFVVDISIGSTLKKLPSYENRELLRILRVLEVAHREIYSELKEGEACTMVLAAEQMADELRVEVMFDRLLLMDLRQKVSKLDMQAYAELRSYTAPPPVIKTVLQAVLSIFYPDEAKEEVFEDWSGIKNCINFELCQKIQQYDPTSLNEDIDVEKIGKKLNDIPHGEVSKLGSVPTEHLCNWLFVCISLVEHLKDGIDQFGK